MQEDRLEGAARRAPPAEELIRRLLAHSHRRSYAARATIIRQGAATGELYYLVSGSVSVLLQDARGREFVLAYLHPGDFFGEVGLFDASAQRTAVVRARTRCEVAGISYARLRALPDLFPELLMVMSRQLALRLYATDRKLGGLAFLDVAGRIARTLLELCREPEARRVASGVEVRISRQELARLAGCSREMVGRVLKTMQMRGVLSVRGRAVLVHDSRARSLALDEPAGGAGAP